MREPTFSNTIDLIERKKAIELADELKDDLPDDERTADAVMAHNEGILEYQTALSKLPPAQPEIIRCKDCKHSSPNGKYGCKSYHYRLYETHEMKPDDFCSRAERRTE